MSISEESSSDGGLLKPFPISNLSAVLKWNWEYPGYQGLGKTPSWNTRYPYMIVPVALNESSPDGLVDSSDHNALVAEIEEYMTKVQNAMGSHEPPVLVTALDKSSFDYTTQLSVIIRLCQIFAQDSDGISLPVLLAPRSVNLFNDDPGAEVVAAGYGIKELSFDCPIYTKS